MLFTTNPIQKPSLIIKKCKLCKKVIDSGKEERKTVSIIKKTCQCSPKDRLLYRNK